VQVAVELIGYRSGHQPPCDIRLICDDDRNVTSGPGSKHCCGYVGEEVKLFEAPRCPQSAALCEYRRIQDPIAIKEKRPSFWPFHHLPAERTDCPSIRRNLYRSGVARMSSDVCSKASRFTAMIRPLRALP
jgi:hypothetical protein